MIQVKQSETQLLKNVISRSYSDYLPVRNATAGLDGYKPMSIMKRRKRKREDETTWTVAAIKKIKYFMFGPNEPKDQLYPAEVFDIDPTESSVEPKKIGEQRSIWRIHESSSWTGKFLKFCASFKWNADTDATSVDLGSIYQKTFKRFEIREWLDSHTKGINQEDLKHLYETWDLFIINDVLYSEKMVIEHGSSAGEKTLDTEHVSASTTFKTETLGCTRATVRPADVGIKPIAHKVTGLFIKKTGNGELILALQQPTESTQQLW